MKVADITAKDWHALFRILRDVPLTANFERPADPKLEREMREMDEAMGVVPDRKMEAEESETLPVAETEAATEAVVVEAEATEAEAVEADGDDLFDPESPEGPGDFEPEPETVGYQLLQHVDSPEHEDPDEAERVGQMAYCFSYNLGLTDALRLFMACFSGFSLINIDFYASGHQFWHEKMDAQGFRRLRAGELVEVLEWPANHLECCAKS